MDESVDRDWMELALHEARRAGASGEVPVGAVLVRAGELLGRGRNSPVGAHDPTAHAEIMALRAAAAAVGNYRLPDTTLYVTLEPCPMCVGAIVHARVGRLVFGATDPKTGAAGSVFNLAAAPAHNHRVRVDGGVLGDACGDELRAFFRARRRALIK
ncbi:MAG: tRNA adenosine(34) deaminase TadA [Halofilum sp. (in: g-proteobacteria)]